MNPAILLLNLSSPIVLLGSLMLEFRLRWRMAVSFGEMIGHEIIKPLATERF
jgi:hypothetical protein